MSNSSLVTYRHIVKNKTKGRGGHKIEKIFVHHMAGNLTVKQCGSVFDNRQASAHYGINGLAIGQYVDEADTAWHCGNFNWNQRSIGIELANDGGASTGWHVADKTIETAIKLIADICQRNGIKAVNYTGDMTGNLCMHRWVCSTSCPGAYLAGQFKRIADGVNKAIGGKVEPAKLEVDGIGGPATVRAMQRFFGTTQDGVISDQNKTLKKYYPALTAVEYGTGGSACIKNLQRWAGASQDGIIGQKTVKAWQKKIGVKDQDGIFGPASMKTWQKYLNEHDKAEYPKAPEKTLADKILDACKTQAAWMKNAKYGDYSPVTINHSKTAGTCVTYEGCVLQRLGYLKSGQYIWQNGSGYGTGKVTGTNDRMTVTYMNNKTLTSLKSKLKAGDIVLLDDNKSGKKGSGGHVFFLTGKWTDKGNPYIWDMEPNRTCMKNQKPRAYNGKRKVLAVVRLK